MRGPIETRIAALRGQVRRLVAIHGLSRLAFGLAAAVLAAGLADWLLDLVPEVRLALLLGVIGLGAYLFARRVMMPLVVRFADLDIALRIEDRWPGLNDRLASTVQFLRQGSDHVEGSGSQAMRDATVEQTLAQVREIDFRQAVDPGATRRAAAWAVAMFALVGAVAAVEPELSSLALRRLVRPFGPDRWPKMIHLTVLDETPRKIARGMPFALAVAVGKGERMPSTARVTYTYPDGETATEPLRPADDGTFRGRVETVPRPFSFRVAAGDNVTDRIEVAVVPPPAFDKTTVRMVPPAYTHQQPLELAAGNTQIRAVEGTKVEFVGEANKPIASASLRRGEVSAKEAVTIDASGKILATSFTVKESQPFWVELKDTEGFSGQDVVRFDIRAVRDEAPRVTIDDPTHDRDVPSGATVPLAITADDDYGLQLIRLIYKVSAGGSEPTREVVVPLWASPDPLPEAGPVRKQEVRHRWDLAPLGDLAPGTVITFYAEGRDFDNLKGPNIGKSREMRLRIISRQDVDRQLEDQQRAIREEIDRILEIQKQAKAPVDAAITFLEKADKLPDPARDQVKNAEIIQRQVNNRVTNKADGLDQKIRQFQQDARDFKADDPDANRQMADLRDAVQRIKDRNLGPAEQALTQATKQLDRPEGDRPNGEAPQPPADQAPAGAPNDSPNKADAKGQPQPKAQGKDQPGQSAKEDQAGGEPKDQAGDQPKGSGGDQPKSETGDAGKASPKADSKSAKPRAGGKAPSDKPSSASKQSLAEAERNQKAIVDELEKMLAGLSQFDTIQTAGKEAKALLQKQEQAMKQAAEAASKPDLAGKSQDALTPEQKAELENQARRQNEIARDLQGLEAKMDEMAKKLDANDPLAASALREAVQKSRKKATAAKMGEAADQLDKNQMGQAQAGQAQARKDLKDLVDAIQNRRERELSRLVAELKNAEAELKKSRDRQAASLKKTQQAQANPDAQKRAEELKKLAKEQQQIQEDLKKQIAKLSKLNAEAGARAGQKAAESMAKAQANMEQEQGDGGDEAEKEEEEAMKDLKQAEEEVAAVRKEAEEQLAMEQIAKMGDALRSIGERQDKMSEETERYEKAKAEADGKLSLAQRSGIRELGRVQAGLKDEATELVDKLGEGAPVFTLSLKKVQQSMEDSAQRLQALKTDGETTRVQKLASGRLKQLNDSLKPDRPKNGGGQQGQQGGGGGGSSPSGGDGIPAAAQIKMLKSLQQELNERTDSFDELIRRQKELNPDQVAELDKLHEDQGILADIVRDLTRPKKDDGEN